MPDIRTHRATTKYYFIGDSVCASGRVEAVKKPNRSDALGHGWVNRVATQWLYECADDKHQTIECYNRGFKGYSSEELLTWVVRDFELKNADYLFIQVGINDIWWGGSDADEIVTNLERLVHYVTKRNPDVQILMLEPVALVAAMKAPLSNEDLHDVQQQIEISCQRTRVPLLKLQSLFEKQSNPKAWLYDGIHPTPLGHKLIADVVSEFLKINKTYPQ
jgi:acyl-CoA thioesterase I